MLRDTGKDVIKIEVLKGGGFKVNCENEELKEAWGATYYGMVTHESLKNLDGKILTLIDAMFQDKEQRKSAKDIFRRMLWFDWVEHNIYKGKSDKGKSDMPVGVPLDTY